MKDLQMFKKDCEKNIMLADQAATALQLTSSEDMAKTKENFEALTTSIGQMAVSSIMRDHSILKE